MIARQILEQINANELLNMDNINSVIEGMKPEKCRIYYICSSSDLDNCLNTIQKSLNQRKLEQIRHYYNKTNILGCAFLSQQIIIIFVKSILTEGKYLTKNMCEKRFYNVLFHELCHIKLYNKGIDDNESIVNKFARDLCNVNEEFLLDPFNDDVYCRMKKQISLISSFFVDCWDTIINSPLLVGAVGFLLYRLLYIFLH